MVAPRFAKLFAIAVSAALVCSMAGVPAYALTDTNLDEMAGASAGVSAITPTSTDESSSLQNQPSADDAESMPDNPTKDLPQTVSEAVPDDATVVSEELAVTDAGEVMDLETGDTVTDPQLVGTVDKPADPLAKTDGESFIPVEVAEVKEAMGDAAAEAEPDDAADTEDDGDVAETQRDVADDGAAGVVVRPVALQNNSYGAYWGTYNGTPAFFEADGTLFVQQARGVIDVSEWQGQIDWQKAKNDGVEGAIIRISYGWGNGFDKQALRNISECKRLGIPFGIYSYSYAYDSTTAAYEGDDMVSLLRQAGVQPGDLSYPVFYDLEKWTWTGHTPPASPSVYDGIVNTWYAKLQAAGYTNLSVYSYTSYLDTALNSANIRNKTRWVASYGARTNFPFATNDRGWQYTSQGSVAGIQGSVDLNAFGNKTYEASHDVTSMTKVEIPNGTYYINAYSKDSSSLEIAGGGTQNGVKTQLYGYNKSGAQRFTFTKQSDGSYVITNVNSGKALDVLNAMPGNFAVVQQYEPNGSAAQRWFIRNANPGYYLQSALGNWVLDLAGAATANGTAIALYEPNGTNAQRFLLSSVDTGIPVNTTVKIASAVNNNLVMDVVNASTANAVAIQLYGWNDTDAQKYRFTEVGNGVYQITNVKSGKLVEIAGGATGNGGTIQQYVSNGTQAQRWVVMKYGSNVTLLNSKANRAIDVPAANAANSVKLQSYASNGTNAQQWTISKAPTVREHLDELASKHRGDLADGTYVAESALQSGKVMDVSGGSTSDYGNVQLYTDNGTDAQAWKVSHDSKGYVTFTNANSGKVLDVNGASTASGANVQQFASNGSWAQKWIAVPGSDGSYTIYSALAKNLALDVYAASTANGANIQTYAANGSKAQQWRMTKTQTLRERLNSLASAHRNDLKDGTYVFGSGNKTSMVLDVSGGSSANGANVQLYQSNDTNAQRWRVTHDSKGYVTLTNVGSGKVLDVNGASTEDGANVQQYASNGTWAQKWIAVKNADGSYTFYSGLHDRKVLDVYGGATSNGANVQLCAGNGTKAQRWVI
ncbi:RICIN domain-containing protein [uncultured Bifidobacterium sp.]|uniref:RICIN domain-containing protein n=1 Tax=uncultured Bifidobacterium sp. TaxID=165187 RepID=UPI002593378B|nr:RICIN domain-containing protein [uncultured Bifidobacterium sp.]